MGNCNITIVVPLSDKVLLHIQVVHSLGGTILSPINTCLGVIEYWGGRGYIRKRKIVSYIVNMNDILTTSVGGTEFDVCSPKTLASRFAE
eukprot:3027025-Ditylum_brightwellii.AAC.1